MPSFIDARTFSLASLSELAFPVAIKAEAEFNVTMSLKGPFFPFKSSLISKAFLSGVPPANCSKVVCGIPMISGLISNSLI